MRYIEIYDTVLRDGTQGEGVSFSLHDKLQITKRLDELGVDYIEGGFPASNDKDYEYFQRVAELELEHAKVCAFGMTRRKNCSASEDAGLKALVESKAPVCTVVGKTWDLHTKAVLRVDLDENVRMISESVRFLSDQGREVVYDAEHFFDGWKTNPEYAAKTLEAAAAAKPKLIVLCDTNGGTMPNEVAELVEKSIKVLEPHGVPVGIHCHNDSDVAVANSIAAVRAGAVQVQGTINGFGERCGNADLVSVIANLCFKFDEYNVLHGNKIEHLTELSRYVYELANLWPRKSQPFVGASAFAHKGGMHVHGVTRNSLSYEHINPERVGNERRVLVSELSGRSNIIAVATKRNLDHDPDLQQEVLKKVVEMESVGYQFEAAEASFELVVRRCAGTLKPHFDRIMYRVIVGIGTDERLSTEATVKVRVNGAVRHEVGEGDGPVNAIDEALRKALHDTFPSLRDTRLVDFKVRVVNADKGTAARIRVFTEFTDGEDIWTTIGVDENIIEASWTALVDGFEYKLCKDEAKSAE